MFSKEIELIKNEEVRDLVKQALEKAPKEVWDKPASSTLKYHPLNENGGIETVYQHTQRVVAMVEILLGNGCFTDALHEEPVTQDEKDLLIASAILHDSCKYGMNPAEEKYTKFEHPILVGQLLSTDNGKWATISHIVGTHSGFWNTSKYSETVLPTPDSRLEILLHEADYLASRRNIQLYSSNGRSLFARLKEAVVGWWNERKISKLTSKAKKQQQAEA